MIAGDEVTGRSRKFRTLVEDNGIGYVMRVGYAFTAAVTPGQRMRADSAVELPIWPGASTGGGGRSAQ